MTGKVPRKTVDVAVHPAVNNVTPRASKDGMELLCTYSIPFLESLVDRGEVKQERYAIFLVIVAGHHCLAEVQTALNSAGKTANVDDVLGTNQYRMGGCRSDRIRKDQESGRGHAQFSGQGAGHCIIIFGQLSKFSISMGSLQH